MYAAPAPKLARAMTPIATPAAADAEIPAAAGGGPGDGDIDAVFVVTGNTARLGVCVGVRVIVRGRVGVEDCVRTRTSPVGVAEFVMTNTSPVGVADIETTKTSPVGVAEGVDEKDGVGAIVGSNAPRTTATKAFSSDQRLRSSSLPTLPALVVAKTVPMGDIERKAYVV